MRSIWTRLVSDQRGATAIEYALIAGSIAVGVAAAIGAVGTHLNTLFTNVASGFH